MSDDTWPKPHRATAGFFKLPHIFHLFFSLSLLPMHSVGCAALPFAWLHSRSLAGPVCVCWYFGGMCLALHKFLGQMCVGRCVFRMLHCHTGCALCHNRIQIVVNLWTYIIMCLSIISIIITFSCIYSSLSGWATIFFSFVRSPTLFVTTYSHSYSLFNSGPRLIAHHWMLPFSDLISFSTHKSKDPPFRLRSFFLLHTQMPFIFANSNVFIYHMHIVKREKELNAGEEKSARKSKM